MLGSISEGNPKKLCYLSSYEYLDALLTEEPEARVAFETLSTANCIAIIGKISL